MILRDLGSPTDGLLGGDLGDYFAEGRWTTTNTCLAGELKLKVSDYTQYRIMCTTAPVDTNATSYITYNDCACQPGELVIRVRNLGGDDLASYVYVCAKYKAPTTSPTTCPICPTCEVCPAPGICPTCPRPACPVGIRMTTTVAAGCDCPRGTTLGTDPNGGYPICLAPATACPTCPSPTTCPTCPTCTTCPGPCPTGYARNNSGTCVRITTSTSCPAPTPCPICEICPDCPECPACQAQAECPLPPIAASFPWVACLASGIAIAAGVAVAAWGNARV